MDQEQSHDRLGHEFESPDASGPRLVLTIGPEASWIQVGAAAPFGLGRRHVLRRLILIFAEAHRARRSPLESTALIARGWPDDRLDHQVMINRLHVAINALRAMGLRDVLQTRAHGYRFAPTVEVAVLNADNAPLTASEMTSASSSFIASAAR